MQDRTRIGRVALAGVLLVLSAEAGAAQEPQRVLVLEQADSTVLLTTEHGTDYLLIGNVVFSHGEDRLSCDRASWLRSAGKVICAGNTRLVQPHRFLSADSLIYERAGQIAIALGRGLLVDSLERMRITGERMIFDRRSHLAICDSLPLLITDFDDSTAMSEITGDRLEYNRKEHRGWAKGNVEVRRGDWTARCGHAETWPDSGIFVLTEKPVGHSREAETKGDSIILYSVNRQLEQVRVLGNAEGVYRPRSNSAAAEAETRAGDESRLWGNQITFHLADRRLTEINACGAARAQYLPGAPESTDGELRGENESSGDSLTIFLENNEVRRVEIRGGGRGTYQNPVSATSSAVDTIHYFGEHIDFQPDSARIFLTTEGKITYGTVELTADRIRYDTRKRTLAAEGTPHPDSAGVFVNPPILKDGTQTVFGKKLTYNVGTGRGRILGSFTEYEKAYYRGEDFRKYTDREFFVKHGVYTTCDQDPPHFSFRGKTMKLIRGDKVISRPVVLHVDEMPLVAIPFYIFPIKPGRHSGFTSMHIGNFEQGQRFVNNVGYYWAASQYWDLEATMDIHEEPGIVFRGAVRYALRYVLSGSLTGTYAPESRWVTSTDPPSRQKSTRWSLTGTHQHTVSPTLSVAGSANFVSDKSYYTDFSLNPEERRNRTMRSQVNINKRWPRASLTVFLQNTVNLDTDEKTRQLPAATFSLPQRSLIPAPGSAEADKRWYHSIYYAYSARLAHDSYQQAAGDRRFATLDHQVSVSAPQKVLGYVTVSPQASGQETWYYVFRTDRARAAGVVMESPARRGTFSLGASALTNLYGFLRPGVAGLQALRHTVTPSIGFSFTPAVTKHDELRSYTGRGGGAARSARSIAIGLGQLLDAKVTKKGKEQQVSLLSGNIGASYNFEATARKWSTVSSSMQTSLARRVSFSMSATHDLYDPRSLDLNWLNPRLLNFSISAATSLRGAQSPLVASSQWEAPDSLPTGLPFDASVSYRYGESRTLARISKNHWISGAVQVNPTPRWRVRFSTNYDLANHRTSDQSFEFYRDLHCWEGSFVWIPGGGRKGYYFKISVKDLPDVKIEKSESGVRGAFFR